VFTDSNLNPIDELRSSQGALRPPPLKRVAAVGWPRSRNSRRC